MRAEWAPPADLAERVIRGIDERQRNQRDLSVMLGLFGVATETASLMLQPEPVSESEKTRETRVADPAPPPEPAQEPDGDME